MKDYLDLVQRVLDHGDRRDDRTGTGTLSVFGGHVSFDLRERFPLLQHKETRWSTAFLEMLWFLRADDNVAWLNEHNCKLWDPWAWPGGDVGPIYGVQWRDWPTEGYYETIDQVRKAVYDIKYNPTSRRIMVSAWNVTYLDSMALPPCHFAHQLYVVGDRLDMQVYQRSWDLMLGAPFNIAQYALLLHLYARATGKQPRMLHFAFGDAHVYINHVAGALEMLSRAPTEDHAGLMFKTENTDIDGYQPADLYIVGYRPEPFIKLPVSV